MRLMAVIWAAAIAGGTPQAGEMMRRVTVCMQTRASALDHRSQAIASEMFAGIGVRIEWRQTHRSCLEAPDAMVINVMNRTPRDYRPGALAFTLPYEGFHIVVFLDRITKSVGPLTAPSLLAHVLAHEIAHMLQGVTRHSETGVMKEQWQARDIERMAWRPLSFTEDDVRLIHLGLQKRISWRPQDGGAAKR